MEPIKVSPMTGILNFLNAPIPAHLEPCGYITTELHNGSVVVDTSRPGDTQMWETGVKREYIEGKWIIVEQYPDKPSAEVGHAKWVKMLTDYHDLPIKDIDLWNLGL